MAVNKVEYNGKTLIDLTGDTVTATTLVSGATAHNKKGEKITGSVVVKSEQTKSFEATANGTYTIKPDSNKTLSSVAVTVNVKNADTVDGYHIRKGTSGATGYITFVV